MKKLLLLVILCALILAPALSFAADLRPYSLSTEYSFVSSQTDPRVGTLTINVYLENNEDVTLPFDESVRISSNDGNGFNANFEVPGLPGRSVPALSRTLVLQLDVPVQRTAKPATHTTPQGGTGSGYFLVGKSYVLAIDIARGAQGAVASTTQVVRMPQYGFSFRKVLAWDKGRWAASY